MNNINDYTLDFFDTLYRNQRMIAEKLLDKQKQYGNDTIHDKEVKALCKTS